MAVRLQDMSTLALYRAYRPGRFTDVVGQDHVTEPLMRALDNDREHHAYLFSGPRGCGKTSSARRSEEHTTELQSRGHLVCRLLLEKKNTSACAGTPRRWYATAGDTRTVDTRYCACA